MRRAAVLSLISLFLLLSFNAYACLIPTPGDLSASMARCPSSDTTTPDTWRFCDIFKTSAFHSHPDSPTGPHLSGGVPTLAVAVLALATVPSQPIFSSSQTRSLITSTVLRI